LAEVSVLYFGPLYEIVGKRREKIAIGENSSLRDLLQVMRDMHGEKLGTFIFDPAGKIRSSIAFAVDGVSVSRLRLGKIKCGRIREFVVLPPISGG
jgi:molybdopterin converting factor small subunit